MESMTKYLTEGEQRKLLSTVRSHGGLIARRDAAWIELLIATGMRVQEFSLMTRADAEAALSTDYIFIPRERRKGGKRDHRVFVTQTVRDCLRELLDVGRAMGVAGDGPLMVSRKHRAMSVRAFQYALTEWAQRAGILHEVTPHWLRHTRAMNILRRSSAREPLRLVQAALGHANLSSTGVYTRVSREELEAELAAVDGRKTRTTVAQLRRQYDLRLEAA